MPIWLIFICYLVAFVAFVLQALGSAIPRLNTLGVGLAAFVAPTLWAAAEAL